MRLLVLGLICALPFFSCKTQEQLFAPDTYDREIIHFGNGGGFAGKYVSYQILKNGQMFKDNVGTNSYEEMTRLDDKLVEQLFLNCVNLKIPEMTLDDPGNMYRFISYKENGNTHKVTWGGKNVEVPKEVKAFYKLLNQLSGKQQGVIK